MAEILDGIRFHAAELESFVGTLFTRMGAPAPTASAVARAVTAASARGFDTHGVRLVPYYASLVTGRRVNLAANLVFTRRAPAVGHLDADDGFGHIASFRAIDEAIAMAKETGVAVVAVGRSSHHGATGTYTHYAAEQGFAAIGMTNSPPIVVPHDGTTPFFGTNPLSFAMPVEGETPLLLDMATSSMPLNRVELRQAVGSVLPLGVAIDSTGAETTDPAAVVALLPLGGTAFGHKGAGLAAMVDVLCSVFTGMPHGNQLPRSAEAGIHDWPSVGHFFIVMNPAVFQALAAFNGGVTRFLDDLRSQPARDGATIMAPGDVEKGMARERAADGVPIDRLSWAKISALAEEFGCDVPVAVN
jgi:ureidoglycolate dehydrogenase (NAD+)